MTSASDPGPVARARELVRQHASAGARAHCDRGLALAGIVESLGADADIVAAAALFPLAEHDLVDVADLETSFGAEIGRLTRELVSLGRFRLPSAARGEGSLAPEQAEALRKMLLAIVTDVRLVLVRLAEQLHLLRSLKRGQPDLQRLAARETREIYAPLANRLGIWQLKWELEDLAFRFLEPAAYRTIAAQLSERRVEREIDIREATATLQQLLAEAGIAGTVAGRPKHLYSIWRKMQRKGVKFGDVFDLRGVRILVGSVADCYAALGIVHSRWPYIQGEFDDYIATPKDNLYRSLHTAVIGPRQAPLEIQIRTHEMHAHAELGVAAHWRYKEGGPASPAFEQKISWLRRLLEPPDSEETERDFIDRMRSEIFEDRVFAVSPQGDVVDLPNGATPLDFAYHVHTDVGHHCRGARINGRIVPLVQPIRNGDRVEIITARNATPSRDWLIPQLGYLASGRSRAKVRAWFRRQDQEQNRRQGRSMLERELQRLGLRNLPHAELAQLLGQRHVEGLYGRLGEGEITLAQVAEIVSRHDRAARAAPAAASAPKRRPAKHVGSDVTVEGVGELMSHLARCCRPVPPEAITGYLTLGRGVSIHRADCANILRLAQVSSERVLAVRWSEGAQHSYPVDLLIHAHDRHGLVRDVSTLLADEKIGILGMNTRTDPLRNSADIDLSIEINGLAELSRLLHRLGRLPNVVRVSRIG
ncbi:MAG TPA: bifunctional (p)ppGpp synthetase/guanosine-3',5'-bis(diphosphate) 3'-pyrophosphohydrolase [Gammaproteobacteria bacterium]|nr:bifunctional (p)ppGpp synthetase/guanosine-3',5'-bis(diphosphate) 3'-pyrophosphohydrolase [Gammaproteobacteria bacterium]